MIEGVHKYIRSLRWNAKLALSDMGVKYYNMLARFVDDHTLELYDPKKQKKETITARNILVAVGGRPTDITHISNAHELTISSDDVFYLKSNFGKTLVVGGSYIALETAGFLTGLGNDVTIISVLLRSFDQAAAAQAVPESIEKLEDGRKRVTYKDKDFKSIGTIDRIEEKKNLTIKASKM